MKKRIKVVKETTALLLDERGYYWMWHNFGGKPQISGPHSEPMLNLKPIKVKNPLDYKPTP